MNRAYQRYPHFGYLWVRRELGRAEALGPEFGRRKRPDDYDGRASAMPSGVQFGRTKAGARPNAFSDIMARLNN